MPDSIVWLRCAPGRLLAKQFHAGGWTNYDSCKTFNARSVAVAGLEPLACLLAEAATDPRLGCIRGALIDGDRADSIRRLMRDDPEKNAKASIRDFPRSWIALDLDGLPLPDAVNRLDLLACAEAVIPRLPAEFWPARCLVQATSGHALKAGARLRLWYWLDRPLSTRQCKTWLQRTNAPVDLSLYSAAQIIYVATPIFSDCRDPLSQRLAMRPGDAVVTVPEGAEVQDSGGTVAGGNGTLSQARLGGIIRKLASAPHGKRNTMLHWASVRLGEAIARGEIAEELAERILTKVAAEDLDIAPDAGGLATVRSGIARGKADVGSAREFSAESI